jgi:sulfite reductase alpha subunit-like flavoprotein
MLANARSASPENVTRTATNSSTPPPEEVLGFVHFLSSLEAGNLSSLQYSVPVSSTQPAARGMSSHVRLTALLEMLGARRLAQCMNCHAQFQDRLHIWAETISP